VGVGTHHQRTRSQHGERRIDGFPVAVVIVFSCDPRLPGSDRSAGQSLPLFKGSRVRRSGAYVSCRLATRSVVAIHVRPERVELLSLPRPLPPSSAQRVPHSPRLSAIPPRRRAPSPRAVASMAYLSRGEREHALHNALWRSRPGGADPSRLNVRENQMGLIVSASGKGSGPAVQPAFGTPS
jgi:hypothetical protein